MSRRLTTPRRLRMLLFLDTKKPPVVYTRGLTITNITVEQGQEIEGINPGINPN